MSKHLRQVPGTNLGYSSVAGWIDLVYWVGSYPRASTPHHNRCKWLYRSLTLGDIRNLSDLPTLAKLEHLFDCARYWDVPSRYGLGRVFKRSELGFLLAETRNRILAVLSGRAEQPRAKGPRFDPQRLPDAALDRLIQRHPDMNVVEELRAERRRRLESFSSHA